MESIWENEVLLPQRTQVRKDMEFDAVVVGGGMAGVLIGYFLQKGGLNTGILEANRVGSGQTGKTSAKITAQHGLLYHRLCRDFGEEKAAEYGRESQKSVETYRELIKNEQIDCDFRSCSSFLYTRENEFLLKQEEKAAKKAGFSCGITDHTELPFAVKGALEFKYQAQFHPIKFIGHLAKELQIFENSRVDWADGGTVGTNGRKVTGKYIIFACHYPFIKYPGYYFIKLRQERSYVLALTDAMKLNHLYFSADDHRGGKSFRTAGEYLLFGGAGHLTGKNSCGGQYELLREEARRLWPDCKEAAHWSAQDCMTPDGVPYIGKFSAGRPTWYVASGFGKWGMVHSMTAARLISGQIIGNMQERGGNGIRNSVFSPQRKTLRISLPEILRGMARATGGMAVRLTGKTPKCTHLGCGTKWNPEEGTWDCQCHGSRYTKEGRVLDGPAKEDIRQKGQAEKR